MKCAIPLQIIWNMHIWYELYTETSLSECTPGWSLCAPFTTHRASKTCVWTLKACDGTWRVSSRQHSWLLSSWDIRASLKTKGKMESDVFAAATARKGTLIKRGLFKALRWRTYSWRWRHIFLCHFECHYEIRQFLMKGFPFWCMP